MKSILTLLFGSTAVLVLFGLAPGIDLLVSGQFHDGEVFPLARDPVNNALRWVLRVAPFLPVLAGMVILVGSRWLPGLVLGLTRRGWAAIVLAFLLGPGLLVNRGLKAYWGRARPRDIEAFGGDADFTAPHVWASECAANCSFVSGEVSAVTALSVALAALLTANRARLGHGAYRAGWAAILALPVLSAFQRISAGAHFLSDAILAALFTLVTAQIVGLLVAPRAR